MNRVLSPVLCLLALMLLVIPAALSQQNISDNSVVSIPDKAIDNIRNHASVSNRRLERQMTRYLSKLEKRENKLKKALFSTDSLTAKALFGNQANTYRSLSDQFKFPRSEEISAQSSAYLPYMDSLKGSLNFLDKNRSLLSSSRATPKLESSLTEVRQLQDRLQSAEQVKEFVKGRQTQIQEALKQYMTLPPGISSQLASYKKDVFYCQQEIQQCKDMFNQPGLAEQKALQLLTKLPAFNQFMQQHSFLSGLFRTPENYGTPAALAGLQTRADVQNLIGNQLASGGPDASAIVQQNMQVAQSQISQLKDKVNKLGSGGKDMDMPDFKVNTNKTKPFLSRLEYGTNLQTVKNSTYYPTTSDLALSVGYKLSEQQVIGIGCSYKVGWGRDIRHMAVSHQGVGLRSYFDGKLKGSLWYSGGAEFNYRSQFNSLNSLKNASAWQQSVLIGISKKYAVSKKVKANVQLLFDALYKRQVPNGQPVVFRMGYQFK